VRDVIQKGDARLLGVDLVVHEHGPQGSACHWALGARRGDQIQVIAPHRRGREDGGTEFAAGEYRELLIVADETALPALTRILTGLEPGFSERAFVEAPSTSPRSEPTNRASTKPGAIHRCAYRPRRQCQRPSERRQCPGKPRALAEVRPRSPCGSRPQGTPR
jgi:NADPH-dependent ferric siderophore reductase